MCKYSRLVVRFLDDELPGEQRRLIEEHLLICLECANDQRNLLEVRSALNQIPSVDIPVNIAPAVMSRIGSERRPLGVLDIWFERRRPPEMASLAVSLSLIWLLMFSPVSNLTLNQRIKAIAFESLAQIKTLPTDIQGQVSMGFNKIQNLF